MLVIYDNMLWLCFESLNRTNQNTHPVQNTSSRAPVVRLIGVGASQQFALKAERSLLIVTRFATLRIIQ